MRDLRPRQQENLHLIRARIDAIGLPTHAEIAQEFGFRSVKAAENPDFQSIVADLCRQQGLKL